MAAIALVSSWADERRLNQPDDSHVAKPGQVTPPPSVLTGGKRSEVKRPTGGCEGSILTRVGPDGGGLSNRA